MWDLHLRNPFERLSGRNVLLFIVTMLVAIFAYIFASAPAANAADASWAGNAITYNGEKYVKLTDGQSEDNTNLPNGIHYGFIDTQQKAHVITFPAGSDVATATGAEYSEYSFVPPGTFNGRTAVKQITLDPQANANQGVDSCDSTYLAGVGWIVCPVTNFLAGAMDRLYEILTGFLTVRPAFTTTDNALYRAWSVMRNFANVAFVIGFMIIIYSQLTSFGLSNYGIKKILPRLILAAILVNISYWICAVAIDLSNILGYSLQNIFIGIRNTIIGSEGNSFDVMSWQSISGFILSGGTAAVAGGIGIYAMAAGGGGAIFMLLPMLVGVLMAVLVALLVMAARQAIITVLVIIAPLAFVAYLLPNTEKYFDKWRGLFMTMLLLFPIFSVLFGGSQLAGTAIIQNADSINLIILGMAVQVAPIVLTPFLIKFSGSLLGRIAGMVNNPNRGAIDRTRKWATERAAQRKDEVLGRENPGFMARRTQNIDKRRRKREGWQSAHKGIADARWSNEKEYSDMQQAVLEAGQVKEKGEVSAQTRYEGAKRTNARIQSADLELRAEKLEHEIAQAGVEEQWENLKAGSRKNLITADNIARSGLAEAVRTNTERSQVLASSISSAKGMQQHNFATELEANPALRVLAGGIDPNGAIKAEATAVSALERAKAEMVKNIKEASPVKPGDAAGLRVEFEKAVRSGNTVAARAYVDLLAEAANPGFVQLREAIGATEGTMSPEMKAELKMHINSNGAINGGAEDIGTWSREATALPTLTNSAGTWANLSPAAFAGMKQSSQIAALDAHGVSRDTAAAVMDGPAFQNLKPAVRDRLTALAGRSPRSGGGSSGGGTGPTPPSSGPTPPSSGPRPPFSSPPSGTGGYTQGGSGLYTPPSP